MTTKTDISREEFEKEMQVTTDVLDENKRQVVEENFQSVARSTQSFDLADIDGRIIFKWPSVNLLLKGERISAQFRTQEMRNGNLMTEAQLKAMYQVPVTMNIDGKIVEVGEGLWTAQEEARMEDIPDEIKEKEALLYDYRVMLKEMDEEIKSISDADSKKDRKKNATKKFQKKSEEAWEIYKQLATLRLDLLQLQGKRLNLFAQSIEEQAIFEKIKLYAPECILIEKDGEEKKYWDTPDKMLNDDDEKAIRLLNLYNLFLRGGDVSFFVQSLNGQTF